jgi:SAM-dependent methyltransferase
MTISMVGAQGALIGSPRRWDFLATMMLELGLKTFVEVGCKEGRTTGFILKNVPDSRVIAIDPWITQEATNDPTKETYADWDFSKIEAEFWANVGEHKDRCEMWRCTSETAAIGKPAPDDGREGWDVILQADLVFIDALHDYEHVMQDISLWWPKVRQGGVLAGHDFNHKWPGVERAVADHFNLADVGIGFDSVWFVVKQ